MSEHDTTEDTNTHEVSSTLFIHRGGTELKIALGEDLDALRAETPDRHIALTAFTVKGSADGQQWAHFYQCVHETPAPGTQSLNLSLSMSLEGGALIIRNEDGDVLRAYGPTAWRTFTRTTDEVIGKLREELDALNDAD